MLVVHTQGLGYADSTPTPKLQQALNLKAGVVTSGGCSVCFDGLHHNKGTRSRVVACLHCSHLLPGNSLDYTDKDMQIMTQHKAVVKEMEAAAIAWVAQLFKKPMFCVKAVTDIVDGDKATQEEFLDNLHSAAAALQQVLPKVLEFVSGKTLREL